MTHVCLGRLRPSLDPRAKATGVLKHNHSSNWSLPAKIKTDF